MLSNKQFCYWLQGYFEIADKIDLDEMQLRLVEKQLGKINEPLGPYTAWLKQIIEAINKCQYRQSIIELFAPQISSELNFVFHHDIDNSYDTEHSNEYLLNIHNGETNMSQHKS